MPTDCYESEQPAKRQKVSESCKLCRAKKTRCDGQRPNCTQCVGKKVACEYNDATAVVSAATLSDIEARLCLLEQRATGPDRELRAVAQHSPAARPAQVDAPSPRAHHGAYMSPECDDRAHKQVESFADHPTTQYVRDMNDLINGRLVSSSQGHASSARIGIASLVVPSRAVADDLVDTYERLLYPHFPVLHMPTFRKTYESLWSPTEPRHFESVDAEATFHGTLNAVLALGSVNTSAVVANEKLQLAETFYHRARKIVPLDAIDVPSLEVVQCLLLITLYLSFTKHSNRCCNTLAIAIRSAESIGLHRDCYSSSENQLQREMARRVWHLCLMMDRLYSSLFGKTNIIQFDFAPLFPAKIDDQYLSEIEVGRQPAGVPSILEAFIIASDVFSIVQGAHDINSALFTRDQSLSELIQVLQSNERIDKIENSIPRYLREEEHEESTSFIILRAQAAVLRVRIFYVRLLLLRPTILVSARRRIGQLQRDGLSLDSGADAQFTLRDAISKSCVQVATSAIRHIHALTAAGLVFSTTLVFVTLSAATAIAAASLLPGLELHLQDDSGLYVDLLSKAFEVLDFHRWQVQGAMSAKEQLEKFVTTITIIRGNGRKEKITRSCTAFNNQLSPLEPDLWQGIDLSQLPGNFLWDGLNFSIADQSSGFELASESLQGWISNDT